MPGQEVRIDESGEIMVRGENVSVGYWNGGLKPLINEEGWLRTGDIAERDEQGNLFFRGRKKDVIVTAAGLNIYPEDLEAELNHQSGVRDACVIQVEGHMGPEPLAVLILEDEHSDPSKIVRQANSSLAEYQHIRRWHIWIEQDFPRTATTGKVIKRIVAETVKSEIEGKAAIPERSSALAEIVASISGATILDPAAKLDTDLKLDSLGRVELMSAIEDRYHVEIDESVFTAATTIEDIEKIIRHGAQAETDSYAYPAWAQRFPATWIRRIVYYLIVFPITRMMSRAQVRGLDCLNNVDGPVLFISNHISMVDHGLILAALPARFRHKLAIAMEGERLRGWLQAPADTGWFTRLRLKVQYLLAVTLFNVFPLPQKSGFKRSFAYAGESVDRGYNVLVFPEGKTTTDGRMIPFMGGIGLLTSNLDIPVVPVKIEGLYEMKEPRRYFARPGEISVTFGEPVRFERDSDPALITRELESRVANLT
jgi:long-chain acyl-CoA synthetase